MMDAKFTIKVDTTMSQPIRVVQRVNDSQSYTSGYTLEEVKELHKVLSAFLETQDTKED